MLPLLQFSVPVVLSENWVRMIHVISPKEHHLSLSVLFCISSWTCFLKERFFEGKLCTHYIPVLNCNFICKKKKIILVRRHIGKKHITKIPENASLQWFYPETWCISFMYKLYPENIHIAITTLLNLARSKSTMKPKPILDVLSLQASPVHMHRKQNNSS